MLTANLTSYLSDLCTLTDLPAYHRAKMRFVNDMFLHPEKVPFNISSSWLGQVAMQPLAVIGNCVQRVQDPSSLFEAGKSGLPLLVVAGAEDKIVNGSVAATLLRPHFKDLELHVVQDGSHALFYDNQDEVVAILLKFIGRVEVCVAPISW